MRTRDKQALRPWIGALVALNLAALGGVGWLLWERGQQPVDVDVDSRVERRDVDSPAPVAWDQRLAPDADDDPLCRDCNVLMISLDIFRPDHMPCWGYDKNTTPNICAMAEHGVMFDNFIVHAYQTPVSQMSLFTGRYPSSSGFVSFASLLGPEIPYFPESMKAAGYNTVAMGSSFEVMTDMSGAESVNRRFTRKGLNPGLSFGRGFDRFIFTGNRNLPTDAIPWLQQHGDDRFFLWTILGTLHWPYGQRGDPALRGMFDPPGYDGILADEASLNFDLLSRIYKGVLYNEQTGQRTPLTDADAAYINARYDFGLWTVDRFVGELLESLPPERLQDTLILLYGVHGEDLGEHGYFGHYDVYDTEVRSTLIVLNPHHDTQGLRISEPIEGVDLSPTLLELLGLPPLPDTDGHSVVADLRAGHGDAERVTFFERIPLWEDIFRHKGGMPPEFVAKVEALLDREVYGDTGLRTARFKLIHRKARGIEAQVSWWAWLTGGKLERPEWELYDIVADPTEQHEASAEHPEELARLQDMLLKWEASLPKTVRRTVPVDVETP